MKVPGQQKYVNWAQFSSTFFNQVNADVTPSTIHLMYTFPPLIKRYTNTHLIILFAQKLLKLPQLIIFWSSLHLYMSWNPDTPSFAPLIHLKCIFAAHCFLEFIVLVSFICHKIQTKYVYLLNFFCKKFIEFVILYDLSWEQRNIQPWFLNWQTSEMQSEPSVGEFECLGNLKQAAMFAADGCACPCVNAWIFCIRKNLLIKNFQCLSPWILQNWCKLFFHFFKLYIYLYEI